MFFPRNAFCAKALKFTMEEFANSTKSSNFFKKVTTDFVHRIKHFVPKSDTWNVCCSSTRQVRLPWVLYRDSIKIHAAEVHAKSARRPRRQRGALCRAAQYPERSGVYDWRAGWGLPRALPVWFGMNWCGESSRWIGMIWFGESSRRQLCFAR